MIARRRVFSINAVAGNRAALRSHFPAAPRDARRGPMGAAMPAPRARPARPLRGRRAAAGATPATRCRHRASRPARRIDPISDSPMVGRFRPRRRADSPPVMPETRCASKNVGVVARGGIEPPTRGFSVPGRNRKHQLHQPVSRGARCTDCPTMQDRAGLIHAKLPQGSRC